MAVIKISRGNRITITIEQGRKPSKEVGEIIANLRGILPSESIIKGSVEVLNSTVSVDALTDEELTNAIKANGGRMGSSQHYIQNETAKALEDRSRTMAYADEYGNVFAYNR